MKKIFLILTTCIVLSSCNSKNNTEKQDISTSEKEPKSVNKSPKNKEFKTKTGRAFIITEEKPSASISKITLTPKGFTEVNDLLKMEESDPFDDAFVADINNDGYDELYIITRGSGSGSYANIYGFASNKDKSVTPIYIPQLTNDDFVKIFQGYMGHDKFYIENNKLLRKYPIYNKEDTQNNPTGGDKILEYNLKMGESSWVLEIKK